MYFRKLFLAAALLVVSSGASADPCFGASPFTDVPEDAIYCTNTEWLKNRNITFGCTATTYCPNDFVTRAAMALFLNRLGLALTPSFIQAEDSGPVDLTPGGSTNVYCQTGDYPVVGYPRRAQISTTFSGLPDGEIHYEHEIVYSTNSGATWQATFTESNRSSAASGKWVNSSLQRIMNLNSGVSYRWGIRITRTITGVPFTLSDFSQSSCFNSVMIHHWNFPLA
jgi:hypothetical protein